MDNIINETEFKTIVGYNPFLESKKNNGRLGRKATQSYVYYLDMFSLLSMIAYRWDNIPLEIPNYQIEKCLFYTGTAGMVKDDIVDKYVILPALKQGALDIYGEPITWKLYSYAKTYNKVFTNNKDGFVCFSNNLRKSNLYLAYRYAVRLQMIDEIIDMNIDQQKTPYILLTDEKTRKTLETILNQMDLGKRAIVTTKELDLENVLKTLDLDVELKAKDLIEAKREIFNEACMYLGITTNVSEKKERLIASEVASTERRFDIYREIGLAPRKYFCEKVNKGFGLNIDVNYVLDEKELEDMENAIAISNKQNRLNINDKVDIKKATKIKKDKK